MGRHGHPLRPSRRLPELYQAERRHLAAVSAAAIKAGVEERRIRITQEQGAMIARALRGILNELGVSEHPDLPAVVPALDACRALAAGSGHRRITMPQLHTQVPNVLSLRRRHRSVD